MRIDWKETLELVDQLAADIKASPRKEGRQVYGVPRGGQIVAGLLTAHGLIAVDHPADADWIVDDVVDSGDTAIKWNSIRKQPFGALIDKRTDSRYKGHYVLFPWEDEEESVIDGKHAVARLLECLGEDPTREGLKETPRRVFEALQEMTTGSNGEAQDILSTVFQTEYDEMIVVQDIPFSSLCEHHLMPFTGLATVGYIPGNGRIVGLSKLARLVSCVASNLQLQERMTQEIALAIWEHLDPKGCGVIVSAEHSCMTARGIRSPGKLVTSSLMGNFLEPQVKSEFLTFVNVPRGTQGG